MKQPDDYRQPDAPFLNNEMASGLSDEQENHARRQTVERSFETQSGYLVLIKQLGSRYALSFKRQIGTPPSSSIFLTEDEAKRLSNIFGTNHQQQIHPEVIEHYNNNINALRSMSKRQNSPFTVMTVLFLMTVTICAIATILIFQTQIH